MMRSEKKVIKDIFDFGVDRLQIHQDKESIKIYKDLIYFRFDEVLSMVYPIFKSTLSEKRWKKLINSFIKNGSKTPFMWEMPKEFQNFILKSSKKYPKYLKQLLWYEWIEIEIYTKNCKPQKDLKLHLNRKYRLGKCVKIKKLDYSFEKNRIIKQDNFLIVYQNIEYGTVLFQELTPFLYSLLKNIDISKKKNLNSLIKEVAKKFNLPLKDSKNILKDKLQDYLELRILVIK